MDEEIQPALVRLGQQTASRRQARHLVSTRQAQRLPHPAKQAAGPDLVGREKQRSPGRHTARYPAAEIPPALMRPLPDDEPAAGPATGDQEIGLAQTGGIIIRDGAQADTQTLRPKKHGDLAGITGGFPLMAIIEYDGFLSPRLLGLDSHLHFLFRLSSKAKIGRAKINPYIRENHFFDKIDRQKR